MYVRLRAYSFMLFVLFLTPCIIALRALKQEFGLKVAMAEAIALVFLLYLISALFFNVAVLVV